ncbi:MAG: FAD:protein FMN transferase [Cupriavidus sp.]|nr:FAD:protein FMN transferase [Cupriavidus sp.]
MRTTLLPNPGRRRCLAGLPLLATAMFVKPALADPGVKQYSRMLLGTKVDIVVQSDATTAAESASRMAFAEMARLEQLMSRYRPDSQISALARAAGRNPVPVAPELMAILQSAKQMSLRSQGAFDITVGAYAGWDFDPAHSRIPSPVELASERQLVDYRDIVLDERRGTAYLRRPGMKLDLGGIAKLPILQAGLEVLRRNGHHNAMINGGGDVLVSGQLQGRNWRVGLRDPRTPERLLGVVALSDGIVASSGDYERCFVRDGHRYHHILDPRTGQPSQGPHGVALVANRQEAVNGLGAAIMVGGVARGQKWLDAQPGVDALIVPPGQSPWLSAGMAARLSV